jgi:hypothetical protein
LARYWVRKKGIRAGENLFAQNSALFRLSPVLFVRRNWVMPNIRRRLQVQHPPWAGSQQLNLCLFGIARGGVRAGGGAGAVCGAVSLTTKNEQMMTEGEDLQL